MRCPARALLACVAIAFSGHAAAAEATYPVRPIRLIVPFAPGGAADVPARELANALTASLGQQVVLDNRAGAGGIVAGELAAKALPDGYTVLMGSIGMLTIIPNLRKSLPYDPGKSFAPVSMVTNTPTIIVARASLPANSLKELIALAKAKPGSLSFGSAGVGTSTHLTGELFKSMAGIDLNHVPYKGTAPAVTDLLGGQIALIFDTMSSIPHIKAGRLKAFAISTATRSPLLPDVPTVGEAALPGFETMSWNGIVVPVATPRKIVMLLNAEIVKALDQPDLRRRLEATSFVRSSTPEYFGAFIEKERARWAKVIRDANIQAE